jgi:hypothetical protein
MEYLVGIALALFFCAAAAGLGMDRQRAFYPAVAIAVASYYLAFAVVDGRNEVMLSEVVIAAVFIGAAVMGFKRSPWIAVVALGGHGVMDTFHHHLVHNTGVPPVWPGFCMAFDVTAAALVGLVMLVRAGRPDLSRCQRDGAWRVRPNTVAPAKRARRPRRSSMRNTSFHLAMRSPRANEPTLS